MIGTFDVTKCDKAQLTAPTEFRLDGQEQLDDQQQLADQKQPAGEKEEPLLSQAELACQIDAANSKLNDFVGKDYRGAEQAKFDIHSSDLDYVKLWFGTPIPTVAASGNLQAMVDEMAYWQSDLHKKYDFYSRRRVRQRGTIAGRLAASQWDAGNLHRPGEPELRLHEDGAVAIIADDPGGRRELAGPVRRFGAGQALAESCSAVPYQPAVPDGNRRIFEPEGEHRS